MLSRNEVRSTFNLWSTVLAETRKMSRERASLAEVMASEMVARLEVMVKDVQGLTKKVRQTHHYHLTQLSGVCFPRVSEGGFSIDLFWLFYFYSARIFAWIFRTSF